MNKLNIVTKPQDYIIDTQKLDQFYYKTDSIISGLEITAYENKILSVTFCSDNENNINTDINECNDTMLKSCILQLDEYFNNRLKDFELSILLIGTEFCVKVWLALTEIEYASTVSYSYIADKICNKNSSRAVGNANKKNPVAIIIPCHRVIGKNKNLVGYNGGLDKKEFLLNLEKNVLMSNKNLPL